MTRPIRILEIRSVRGTGGGPEKTILLGTARTDPRRFAITICYLRDARDQIFSIDTKAAGLPVEYVEILERHSFDPSVFARLRQLVRDREIDIVHAHDYKTNVLAWLLMRRDGVLALSTVHGWTGHTPRERYLYYPLDKRVLRTFPQLIAVSEEIRRELVRHGARPDRVVTILNGIDHRSFQRDRSREADARRDLGLAEDDVAIGAIGRLEPQKRFDLLIEAFAQLHRRQPALKLLIAGDGSLRQELEAQINRLQLAASCRLLGHQNDVGRLHHAFDLFVQSSDYEGTPNAVLEAMAFETPLVATDVGGTSELVRHTVDGLVIPPRDGAALVDAMRQALGDRDAALRRAGAARRRVETDLSFETRMAAVEAIYMQMHERRQGARPSNAIATAT